MNVLCSPNTKDVESYLEDKLNIGEKILHIVPTKILERRRRRFYRKHLKQIDEKFQDYNNYYELTEREQSKLYTNNGIYIYELHSFFDDFLIDHNVKHLTNHEASVYVERALKQFNALSNKPWLDNITGILDFFIQIKIGEIDYENVNPELNINTWNTLMKVFVVYNNMLKENQLLDKADAYLKILKEIKIKSFDKIYIDGAFLPFSPLLNQLISKLAKEKIKFIIPYDVDKRNNLKFKVLEQTYSALLPIDKWTNIKRSDKSLNLIHRISNSLFEEKKLNIDDLTFMVKKFSSAEEEIRDIVNHASSLLASGEVSPEKVAIVSSDPMNLRKQVNEYLEIYDLYKTDIERPLIDFPIGKIVYIMYQIHIDERIGLFNDADHYFDDEMMSDLLHVIELSEVRLNLETYNKLKAFFTECLTFEEWYSQLGELKLAIQLDMGIYKDHPLNHINEWELNNLEQFLKKIEQLSRNLINNKSVSFVAHLNNLLLILKENEGLNPYIVKYDLRLFEQKVKEFAQNQRIAENISITPKEFGRRIHSILTKIDEVDASEEPPLDKIIVTGPNNIEYQEYEYIYIVQFTQTKFPEKISYTWPMNEEFDWLILNYSKSSTGILANTIEEYYTYRSLYYFFITLNSTVKNLIISYSERYDSERSSPSHLLFDIADLLIEDQLDDFVDDKDFEKLLEEQLEKNDLFHSSTSMSKEGYRKPIESADVLRENPTISTEDLIKYELCPQHFYYSKKYDELNFINDPFQLRHYAVACIYEKVVQLLVKKRPKIQFNSPGSKELLKEDYKHLFEKAKTEIGSLFLLPTRDWEDIYLRSKYLYEGLIDSIFKTRSSAQSIELNWNNRIKSLKVSNLYVEGKRDLSVKYSDNNIRHYSISMYKKLIRFENKNQRKDYYTFLDDFFLEKEKAKKELQNLYKNIAENKFRKKPGDFCKFCKFKYWCLGNEVSK